MLERAERLLRAGDCAQAESLCREALVRDPGSTSARYLLGVLLGQQGRLQEAAALLEEAAAAVPDWADLLAALGNVYLLQEKDQMAAACYLRALEADPDNVSAHANLGLIRQKEEKHEAALSSLLRAHQLAPELPVGNLVQQFMALERFDDALALLRDLHAKDPARFEVLKCLAQVLRAMHRPAEALEFCLKARALDGGDCELLIELAVLQRDLGRIDEALETLAAVLAVQPGSAVARWHRSLIYLSLHEFERGWESYDLRLASAELASRPMRYPEWDGVLGTNKRVLVYGEQGVGDEIMFASCLPEVIAGLGHCYVECSPKLEALFRRSFPQATVYASLPDKSVPADVHGRGIDAEVAIGSIPRFLRRSKADFPPRRHYLTPDPARVEKWRCELQAIGPGVKVGISWIGGSQLSRRPVRSIPLLQWRPILSVPGVHYVDLQYFDCTAEIAQVEKEYGVRIHRWKALQADYEDTAAMVGALDLVISVCTAVVHLGGALGQAVWVMAPYSPEWRYGMAGEGMPWYPSVTMFRQPGYGDWPPVIARVAAKLHERAAAS